jgi:hypothetical protein
MSDEAWRGDQHHEDDPLLRQLQQIQEQNKRTMEMFFGREPTPEEQKVWDQQIKDDLERGEEVYPTLKPISWLRPCPACRWPHTKMFWHPAPSGKAGIMACHRGPPCLAHVGQHEHFYRWCRRCAHFWWERPLTPRERRDRRGFWLGFWLVFWAVVLAQLLLRAL